MSSIFDNLSEWKPYLPDHWGNGGWYREKYETSITGITFCDTQIRIVRSNRKLMNQKDEERAIGIHFTHNLAFLQGIYNSFYPNEHHVLNAPGLFFLCKDRDVDSCMDYLKQHIDDFLVRFDKLKAFI